MSRDQLAPPTEVIIYQAEDGLTRLNVRLQERTVWLTQRNMAELYQTTPQNITTHLKAIYSEGELDEQATCKEYLQVRTEGNRSIKRMVKHYGLEAVLAVGYRVRSPRATHFRQWATAVLSEYLDYAEDRVKMRKTLTLSDWRRYVDNFLLFNERPLLSGKGKMSHKSMKTIAHQRYEEFDQNRKRTEAVFADVEDLKQLEDLERDLSGKGGDNEGD